MDVSLLTSSFLYHCVVGVQPTVCVDADVVQAARHQRVEHTLRAGLGHGVCVYDVAMVTECDCVLVHLPLCRPPPNTEEIWPTVITDRDSTHCCRHCQLHIECLEKGWVY